MPKNASSVLVIGTGFLGSAIVELFSKNQWTVHSASYSGGADELSCDLGDDSSVAALASQVGHPQVIIHCASSGRGNGIAGYQSVYRDGTAHLATHFPESHLIYTSSSSVYGQVDGEVVTESSETTPIAKTSEVLLEAEANILATQGTALRLAGLYGPERSVILKKILKGEAVIEDQGQRHLNQIHRDDAASAVFHAANHPELTRGQVFNVADSTPLSQKACYQALAELLGLDLPPTGPRDLNKKRGWTNKQVSNQKLIETGWTPNFPSFLDAVPQVAPTLDLS